MEVNRKEFLDAVMAAQKFSPTKSSLAVLRYLELDFGESVKISATDLDTYITTTVEGISEEEKGKVYFTGKQLADALKTIRGETVTLEIANGDPEPNACPKCGSEKFDMPEPVAEEEGGEESDTEKPDMQWNQTFCCGCGYIGKDTEFYHDRDPKLLNIGEFFSLANTALDDEFPTIPETPENTTLAFRTTVEKLSKVMPAATREESSFKLNGVYFDDNHMVATDGHRMHWVDATVYEDAMLDVGFLKKLTCGKSPDTELSFRMGTKVIEPEPVDGKIFNDLKKADLLEIWTENGYEEEAPKTVPTIKKRLVELLNEKKPTVQVQKNQVYLEFGNTKIVHRPLEANFPDYKVFISSVPEKTVTVESNLLLEAMEQSLAIANERYRAVKITFNGCLDMESFNPDVGEFKRVKVPVVSGAIDPEFTAGFNPQFIMEVMKLAEKKEEVRFCIPEDGGKPIYIQAEKFNALVMAMRV